MNMHALDWGRKGHAAVAYIAEENLSLEAKEKIAQILGNVDLADVASYADEIKRDPQYRKFSPWHYVNMEPGEDYVDSKKSEDGDLVVAIAKCKEVLTDKSSSAEDKAFYLKLLIHFIGDLHQPLHCGVAENKGGNSIQVQYRGRGTNLHSLWDTKILEDVDGDYKAFGPVKNKKLYKKYAKGDVLDWVKESQDLANNVVYPSVKVGQKLSDDYFNEFTPIIEQQIKKGGYRLAYILNSIFE